MSDLTQLDGETIMHFDSDTLDYLAYALRFGNCTQHTLAPELCERTAWLNRRQLPVSVGGGATSVRGAHHIHYGIRLVRP